MVSSTNSGTPFVTVGTYQSGNSHQLWQYQVGTMGNALISQSSYAYGQYLCTNSGTSLFLSDTITNYTKIGFLSADYWIPCTSISMSDVNLNYLQTKYIYPTFYGTGGQMSNVNSNYVEYKTTDNTTNVVSCGNQYSNNVLISHLIGMKTVRITHKITKVTTTFTVRSGPLTFSRGVTPIQQEQPNWCWVATGLMLGKDVNPTTTLTQSFIFQTLQNMYDDVTGSELDIGRIFVLVTGWEFEDVLMALSSNCSELIFLNYIYNQTPFVIGYANINTLLLGHSCFIDGFSLNGTMPKFEFIDPDDGSSTYKSYSEMQNYGSLQFVTTVLHASEPQQ